MEATTVTAMPTQEEIIARLAARKDADFFGFEVSEYILAMSFENARPYIQPDVTPEQWQPHTTREDFLQQMHAYMEFAWDKANNRRGISANRSVQHYIAWTWLMGDRDFSEELDRMYSEYCHYGKPILERICQQYGWDCSKWDDGLRTNGD